MQPRHLDLRNEQALLDEVQRLHERGYRRAGRWNLAQVCWHLTQVMNQSIEGFSFQGPWFVRKVLAPWLRRRVFSTRRLRRGLSAPGALRPPDNLDQARCVADFTEAVSRVMHHNGPLLAHPFLGRLTREQWRQFHLIHAGLHLGMLIPD